MVPFLVEHSLARGDEPAETEGGADAGQGRRNTSLERNAPLALTERRQILAPVKELGAKVRVIRVILRCFQRTAILQKHRDSCAPEGVVSDARRQVGSRAPFLDDAEHVPSGDPRSCKPVVLIK